MKHAILAVPRNGITIVNDQEVIIIGHDNEWNAGECVMVNTVSEPEYLSLLKHNSENAKSDADHAAGLVHRQRRHTVS